MVVQEPITWFCGEDEMQVHDGCRLVPEAVQAVGSALLDHVMG